MIINFNFFYGLKMLPIRCFTCNKVLARYQDAFDNYKAKFSNQEEIDYSEFFNHLNIQRICCRKIFLTHIDIFQYDPPFTNDNIICKSTCQFKRILKAD